MRIIMRILFILFAVGGFFSCKQKEIKKPKDFSAALLKNFDGSFYQNDGNSFVEVGTKKEESDDNRIYIMQLCDDAGCQDTPRIIPAGDVARFVTPSAGMKNSYVKIWSCESLSFSETKETEGYECTSDKPSILPIGNTPGSDANFAERFNSLVEIENNILTTCNTIVKKVNADQSPDFAAFKEKMQTLGSNFPCSLIVSTDLDEFTSMAKTASGSDDASLSGGAIAGIVLGVITATGLSGYFIWKLTHKAKPSPFKPVNSKKMGASPVSSTAQGGRAEAINGRVETTSGRTEATSGGAKQVGEEWISNKRAHSEGVTELGKLNCPAP